MIKKKMISNDLPHIIFREPATTTAVMKSLMIAGIVSLGFALFLTLLEACHAFTTDDGF